MNPSPFSRLAGTRNLSRDQIGILVALIVGITGQLIAFLIPDPLEVIAPQIPMLTPQDWPGSTLGTKMFFTDNWRVSYSPSTPWSPFLWEERRGFYQSLYLSEENVLSSIDQTVVWYADPDENADVWNELDPDTYNGWPIIETRRGSTKPVSYLACNPDLATSPPQCWYLASWEHWFTAIFFYRQENNEDRLKQDIHQLVARMDQLLMSAPGEPCYGFLCTNQERNGNQP